MQIRSESKYIRMSPRKVRLVAHAVRRLSLNQALLFLENVDKKAAGPIMKTLLSAIANAENNHKQPKSTLYIDTIQVNEGPMFKRWRAASRGMAHGYAKKTSHIEITLGVIKSKKQTAKGKKKQDKVEQLKKDKREQSIKEEKVGEKVVKPKQTITQKVKSKKQKGFAGFKNRFVRKTSNRTTNK